MNDLEELNSGTPPFIDSNDIPLQMSLSPNLEPAQEKQIDVINDCDDETYYSVCFCFISFLIIGAINIDDLTFIFGMIAAFSESMLNFVFPGLFFLIGSHYYKQNTDSRLKRES